MSVAGRNPSMWRCNVALTATLLLLATPPAHSASCGDPCEHTDTVAPILSRGDDQLVVVTGGAGFIGSNLVDQLLSLGYWVRVLDNLSTGDLRYVPVDHPRLQLLYVDITDYAALLDGISRPWTGCAAPNCPAQVEMVFHLAAMSKVGPSLGDPSMVDVCIGTNVQGTANVLRATLTARDSGSASPSVRVLYAGSSTAYGNSGIPFNELKTAFNASSPYAASKYQGEALMQTWSTMYGLPTLVLRFFMVWGPREPAAGAYAVVTGVFSRQRAEGKPLTIQGDGTHSRDMVHVKDVARALLLGAQKQLSDPVPINIGAGRSVSVQQIADMISPKQERLPARAHDLVATCADTCRAKRQLQFETELDFETEFKAHLAASDPGWARYWQRGATLSNEDVRAEVHITGRAVLVATDGFVVLAARGHKWQRGVAMLFVLVLAALGCWLWRFLKKSGAVPRRFSQDGL